VATSLLTITLHRTFPRFLIAHDDNIIIFRLSFISFDDQVIVGGLFLTAIVAYGAFCREFEAFPHRRHRIYDFFPSFFWKFNSYTGRRGEVFNMNKYKYLCVKSATAGFYSY